MAKFRKKPVVIDAYQIPSNENTVAVPEWVVVAVLKDQIKTNADGSVEIPTLEGTMRGDVGDWIIKGIKGEFYPCKPDVFAATYDAIELAS
jgi:hypothetical protein